MSAHTQRAKTVIGGASWIVKRLSKVELGDLFCLCKGTFLCEPQSVLNTATVCTAEQVPRGFSACVCETEQFEWRRCWCHISWARVPSSTVLGRVGFWQHETPRSGSAQEIYWCRVPGVSFETQGHWSSLCLQQDGAWNTAPSHTVAAVPTLYFKQKREFSFTSTIAFLFRADPSACIWKADNGDIPADPVVWGWALQCTKKRKGNTFVPSVRALHPQTEAHVQLPSAFVHIHTPKLDY